MSDLPVHRRRSPRSSFWASLLLSGALSLSAGACAGSRGSAKVPTAELLAAGWIDAEPVGAAALEDPSRLEALAGAGLRGRILRLDRLLDLYDGARFAGDKQARESLWLSLGGYSSTRGIDASREVVLRLLDEAYAIEDLAAQEPDELGEDEQRFVADAIMLLSTDMFLPDSAETLITQTLAYRVLTESGHPRVADNAHWRLYDHVRGVLEGAVELGPELRADVLVHALYAEREDLSAWLEDLAPHARPPLPSPAKLWALLDGHREALGALPRWLSVVASRTEAETQLRETAMALLPRPRDPSWALVELARGTGQRESLAPVVLLGPGALTLEPSSASPRTHDPAALDGDGDGVTAAIEGLLARDGRGTVLLASAPDVPAPEYAASLAAIVAARASRVEFAVHEPSLYEPSDPSAEGELPDLVLVVLPLWIARPDERGPGARALRDSRIHVQLSGRGPRIRVDGRWLSAAPTLPSDLLRLVDDLHRAYPREHTISLGLASNVQHQQLIDVLAAFTGGITPAFTAAGWMPDATIEPAPQGDASMDAALAARLQLQRDAIVLATSPKPVEGVPDSEWARIEQATRTLIDCAPELELELPKRGLELALTFSARELTTIEASGRRVAEARLDAVEVCAQDRLRGFRLREHDATLTVTVTVSAAPAPAQ